MIGGETTEPVLKLRDEGLEWREVEGQVVVLDLEGSVYLTANASGAALWPALVSGTTRSQLVAVLVESFGIDESQASADVAAFVGSLEDKKLLEQVQAG